MSIQTIGNIITDENLKLNAIEEPNPNYSDKVKNQVEEENKMNFVISTTDENEAILGVEHPNKYKKVLEK